LRKSRHDTNYGNRLRWTDPTEFVYPPVGEFDRILCGRFENLFYDTTGSGLGAIGREELQSLAGSCTEDIYIVVGGLLLNQFHELDASVGVKCGASVFHRKFHGPITDLSGQDTEKCGTVIDNATCDISLIAEDTDRITYMKNNV
jgi:hypothetical protein